MFKKVVLFTSIITFFNISMANDTTTNQPTKIIETEKKTSPIEVSDAWARASLASNKNSAAYMEINNPTNEQITVLGASAITVANNVELHKSFVDEKGISRMTSIDKIVVPANSTISLSPGGIHIMLLDLKRKLQTGDNFDIILTIDGKDPLSVKTEIR
jgi:periplasmic copper chaperone A